MLVYHIWIIAGIACLILEVFTPGFFIASVGIGAFCAAVASRFDLNFTWQIISLTAGTLLTFLTVRPLLYAGKKNKENARTAVHALIGREALVLDDIINHENRGRVKIGGEEWKARSASGAPVEKNTVVTVEKIEGVTAFVTPINPEDK